MTRFAISILILCSCVNAALSQEAFKGENGKFGFKQNDQVIIPPKYDNAWSFTEGLGVVLVNGKWGFIDKNDRIIIEPQFNGVIPYFQEGVIPVLKKKWGFIDKNGIFVIQPKYDNVNTFHEGLAPVKVKKRWGFIDKNDTFIIQPQFDYAGIFSEGLAEVKKGDKWGYIDKNGKLIFDYQFDLAYAFLKGIAHVRVNGRDYFIDKDRNEYTANSLMEAQEMYKDRYGKSKQQNTNTTDQKSDLMAPKAPVSQLQKKETRQLAKARQSQAQPIQNQSTNLYANLKPKRQDGKYGYVDEKDIFLIQPVFDKAYNFYDGVAKIEINGKYGFINKSGSYIIQPVYDMVMTDKDNGIYRIKQLNKWGMLSMRAEEIFPVVSEKMILFDNGESVVKINGKCGFINLKGNYTLQPTYEDIEIDSENNMYHIKQNGKWGYMDKAHRIITPIHFEEVNDFHEDLAAVKLNGKYGFINKAGKLIIQPQFDKARKFSGHHAAVMMYGKFYQGPRLKELNYQWSFIDRDGKYILPLHFDSVDDMDLDGANVVRDGHKGYIYFTYYAGWMETYDDL